MVSRTGKRLVVGGVLLFFIVGLFFIEQRPQKSEHNQIMDLIHDLVMGPAPEAGQLSPGVALHPEKPPALVPDEHKEQVLEPCTILSPLKGFIDLRGLSSAGNEGKAVLWGTRGFDSGHNYSIGVCLTPIKRTHLDANIRDGLNASEVGAFYIDPASGEYVLMGQISSTPEFRGRKLTLTYSNGSFCDSVMYRNGERLRRKTILTFTCDRDMMSKAHVSYVAAVDDCTYLFEIRSNFACPTAAKADNLAAMWIFVLIFLAALMVYFSGGFLYRNLKR